MFFSFLVFAYENHEIDCGKLSTEIFLFACYKYSLMQTFPRSVFLSSILLTKADLHVYYLLLLLSIEGKEAENFIVMKCESIIFFFFKKQVFIPCFLLSQVVFLHFHFFKLEYRFIAFFPVLWK